MDQVDLLSLSIYEVARPQASDAVGNALRGIYAQCALTDDMLRLLSQLDDIQRSPGNSASNTH